MKDKGLVSAFCFSWAQRIWFLAKCKVVSETHFLNNPAVKEILTLKLIVEESINAISSRYCLWSLLWLLISFIYTDPLRTVLDTFSVQGITLDREEFAISRRKWTTRVWRLSHSLDNFYVKYFIFNIEKVTYAIDATLNGLVNKPMVAYDHSEAPSAFFVYSWLQLLC